MGQSIGSIGNSHKQKGSGDQQKNQPSSHPGQKMADQPAASHKGKPDGGADQGARSVR
jgi:hypothetical protein